MWTQERAGQLADRLVHDSHAGSQYTSIRYTDRLLDVGAVASISTVGDNYDNAEADLLIGSTRPSAFATTVLRGRQPP